MRPVQIADIEVASRVLLALPAKERAAVMTDILERAKVADEYRQNLGRPHPDFGVGSVMSAASYYARAPRPAALNQDALGAMYIVINGLIYESAHQYV